MNALNQLFPVVFIMYKDVPNQLFLCFSAIQRRSQWAISFVCLFVFMQGLTRLISYSRVFPLLYYIKTCPISYSLVFILYKDAPNQLFPFAWSFSPGTQLVNSVPFAWWGNGSKTHERLKERFLIRRNGTKRANFRGSPLFQATYNKNNNNKNRKTSNWFNLSRVSWMWKADGRKRCPFPSASLPHPTDSR